MKIYPYHPLYHMLYQKAKKSFFVTQKSLRVLKFLRVFSDRVLFRFLIDGILFRVLSDRVFFEYLVLESSSGFAVIDSSLESSVLFFRHAAIFFLSNHATILLIKNMFCFILYSPKELYTKFFNFEQVILSILNLQVLFNSFSIVIFLVQLKNQIG